MKTIPTVEGIVDNIGEVLWVLDQHDIAFGSKSFCVTSILPNCKVWQGLINEML